jgi:hypothetical protein
MVLVLFKLHPSYINHHDTTVLQESQAVTTNRRYPGIAKAEKEGQEGQQGSH